MNTEEYFNELLKKVESAIQSDTTDFETDEDGKAYLVSSDGRRTFIQSPLTFTEIQLFGCLLASKENTVFSCARPYLNTEYKNYRININLPPFKKNPTLIIRIHRQQFRSIGSLFENGMIPTTDVKDLLLRLVKERKNIIISGETGSGKTTLLSALVDTIDDGQKVIIIEDTQEITTDLSLQGRMKISDTVSGEEAIAESLRQNPDRIIYGEVRTSSALDLLKAWNTGHSGGMGTIHANSCLTIPERLNQLCMERKGIGDQSTLIGVSLDIGIQISLESGKRAISEIYDFKAKEFLYRK